MPVYAPPLIDGPLVGGSVGCLLYVGTGGVFAQDAVLVWDPSANRLFIGHGSTIQHSTYNPCLQVNGSGADGSIGVLRYNSLGSGGALASLSASRRTTPGGSAAALQSGDGVGTLDFNADDGTDLEVAAARIHVVAEANSTSNQHTASLRFATSNAGAATERIRVDHRGNLLIGTTSSPTANDGKVLVLGDNGASDPTLGASTCAIYQKSGEIYHKDAAGNASLQSPHAKDSPGGIDTDFDMILRNENARLGKKEWIHLSRMARVLERISGERLLFTQDDLPPGGEGPA